MMVQMCSFNQEAAGGLFAVVVVAVLSTMFAVPPMMLIEYLANKVGGRQAGRQAADRPDGWGAW